jgi:hypothetical protein
MFAPLTRRFLIVGMRLRGLALFAEPLKSDVL